MWTPLQRVQLCLIVAACYGSGFSAALGTSSKSIHLKARILYSHIECGLLTNLRRHQPKDSIFYKLNKKLYTIFVVVKPLNITHSSGSSQSDCDTTLRFQHGKLYEHYHISAGLPMGQSNHSDKHLLGLWHGCQSLQHTIHSLQHVYHQSRRGGKSLLIFIEQLCRNRSNELFP